jgi:hypothetical protein
VHVPLAQARPPLPHDVPSLAVRSSGQVAFDPVQVSAKSQVASTAGRQTVPPAAYWQVDVQHAEFEGSQSDPEVKRQAKVSGAYRRLTRRVTAG